VPLANRLIGREDDRARLEKLVTAGGNVTLIGPGGVGKTRLARELAGWHEEYGEMVPFAQLADVTPEASEDGVAAALGYESVDAAIVGLAEHAGIVVLDNCEHMTGVVRRFIEHLREDVTDAVVVATSRAPIGVEGEHLFPVMPLGLPSRGGHDADRAPAVQLFFDRALAAGAALEPRRDLLTDIGELCRKLDGIRPRSASGRESSRHPGQFPPRTTDTIHRTRSHHDAS
jgi:predicted ATPase